MQYPAQYPAQCPAQCPAGSLSHHATYHNVWALGDTIPGRVLLGGPLLALGYWGDPVNTAQRFVDVALQATSVSHLSSESVPHLSSDSASHEQHTMWSTDHAAGMRTGSIMRKASHHEVYNEGTGAITLQYSTLKNPKNPNQQPQQYSSVRESTTHTIPTPPIPTRMVDTGDIGFVDEHGCLHIVGRADLQVLVDGVRVDVVQVQRVLEGNPAVVQAIVFVIQGMVWLFKALYLLFKVWKTLHTTHADQSSPCVLRPPFFTAFFFHHLQNASLLCWHSSPVMYQHPVM